MSLNIIPKTPFRLKFALNTGVSSARVTLRFLRLVFISGPWLLLTSRLSAKSASLMIMLCVPALLFCSAMTIPALIFDSEQQQAYFYSARVISQDPACWFMLAIGGLSALASLAIPATQQMTAVRY